MLNVRLIMWLCIYTFKYGHLQHTRHILNYCLSPCTFYSAAFLRIVLSHHQFDKDSALLLGGNSKPSHSTRCLSAVAVNMIGGTNVVIQPGKLIFTNAYC